MSADLEMPPRFQITAVRSLCWVQAACSLVVMVVMVVMEVVVMLREVMFKYFKHSLCQALY